jgi:hypothetical protein
VRIGAAISREGDLEEDEDRGRVFWVREGADGLEDEEGGSNLSRFVLGVAGLEGKGGGHRSAVLCLG